MANIDFIPDAQAQSMPSSQSSGGIDFIPDDVPQGTSQGIIGQGLNNIRQAFTGNLQNAVNSPGVQGILGAGDAWRNAYASGLNMLPGVNIPMVNNTNGGFSSGVGRAAGTVGSFLAGGEGVDAARFGSSGVPYLGSALSALSDAPGATGMASWLPGVARRAIGSGMYGVATDQSNRLSGGAFGTFLSPIADAVPGAADYVSKAAQYFMPTKYMQGLLQNLGGGQSLEDATKSVIQGVKTGYENQTQAASNLYDPVYNAVRNSDIYNPIKDPTVFGQKANNTNYFNNKSFPVSYQPPFNNGLDPTVFGTQKAAEKSGLDPTVFGSSPPNSRYYLSSGSYQKNIPPYDGQYTSLSPDTFSNYTSALKNLHSQFLDSPTFDNAHQLQSQLGATMRKLDNGRSAPDPDTLNTIENLGQARSALKNDMNNFLSTQPDDLQNKYQEASDYFLNNVVPYRNNSKIYGMATGDITNMKPSSLGNVFAGADDDVKQVLSTMSPATINNLLYTKLGQRVPSTNADAFMRNYDSLDQQGLGSAVSPDVQGQVAALKRRIFARNALQFVPGFVSGLKAAGGHGVVPGLGAAVAGAGVGKPIINYIQARLPMEQIAQTIRNSASASYPSLRAALLSNSLNRSGGNQ